mmetsp:Transcript_38165/g.107848  ORF Transcript_38165/g.107848 Transcript_38165/m.107848 type:complete len:628 (-) Transcript_38165:370-2253(-)|eukprot:CAMPEP_0117675126 /NCGR_PEP_ID=MMETSP0804-20121206/15433_1 /TAXON_ID=1074897 /ORGANISM="Tetraselmis astigmatica, Strain CCMP880" /LENGTH=627 /DNA_ID=CAMNT_0005484097 /DNA_START=165 /DNA_END=2048 /DNA_ORIENTATION=+
MAAGKTHCPRAGGVRAASPPRSLPLRRRCVRWWAAVAALAACCSAPAAAAAQSDITAQNSYQGTHSLDVEALQAVKDSAKNLKALSTWDFATLDPCGSSSCSLPSIGEASWWSSDTTSGVPGGRWLPGNSSAGEAMEPCNFYGVGCDKGRVTQLVLPDTDLDLREVPEALSHLTALRVLDLSGNGLRGSLPGFLPQALTRLERLSLAGNNLTGELPNEMMRLRALRVLDLSDNEMEGSIGVLSMLNSVEALNLSGNSFRGSVPFVMTSVRDTLVALDISFNCRLCGGLQTSTVYAALEVFNHAGTHVWTLCTSNLDGYCPTDAHPSSVNSFALGIQMVVVVVFILLGSLMVCFICTYIRHPSILSEVFAGPQSLRSPSTMDETALTTAALEELQRAQAFTSQASTSSSHPPALVKARSSIGAVIINPGSTLQSPNICVAVMELESIPHATSMTEQQLQFFRPSHEDLYSPGGAESELRRFQSMPAPVTAPTQVDDAALPVGTGEEFARQGGILSRLASVIVRRHSNSTDAPPQTARVEGNAAGLQGQPPPVGAGGHEGPAGAAVAGGVEMVVQPAESSSSAASLWARAGARLSFSMQRAAAGSPRRPGSPQYPMSPAGSGEMPMVFV